ncbi:hypothetical protein A2U01_0080104, partial [Trifolium medium]|nr:hypothetical protein [Trifolium medium]
MHDGLFAEVPAAASLTSSGLEIVDERMEEWNLEERKQ